MHIPPANFFFKYFQQENNALHFGASSALGL